MYAEEQIGDLLKDLLGDIGGLIALILLVPLFLIIFFLLVILEPLLPMSQWEKDEKIAKLLEEGREINIVTGKVARRGW